MSNSRKSEIKDVSRIIVFCPKRNCIKSFIVIENGNIFFWKRKLTTVTTYIILAYIINNKFNIF